MESLHSGDDVDDDIEVEIDVDDDIEVEVDVEDVSPSKDVLDAPVIEPSNAHGAPQDTGQLSCTLCTLHKLDCGVRSYKAHAMP